MITGRPATPPTEEQIDKICRTLRRHAFRETAIACAGVSPYVVRNWIRAGVKDQQEGANTPEARLVSGMDEAERIAESELIDGIQERGLNPFTRSRSTRTDDKGNSFDSETLEPPDWKALAWIAERRGAKRWGIKKHLTVAIDEDRARLLRLAEKTLDTDAFNKLLAAIASAEDASTASEGDAGAEEGEE